MPLHSEFPINNYSVCQSGLWGFLGFLFYLQDVSVSFLHLSGFNVIAHTDCSMNKWNCMFKLLWKPLTGSIFYDLKVFIIQQEAFKVHTYVHTFSFFFDLIFCLLFREGSYSSHTWIIVIFKELETWNYLHLFVFFFYSSISQVRFQGVCFKFFFLLFKDSWKSVLLLLFYLYPRIDDWNPNIPLSGESKVTVRWALPLFCNHIQSIWPNFTAAQCWQC